MKYLIFILLILNTMTSLGQDTSKPKLVVGIVIDQMRAEYLYRFQDNYTEDGFKLLMNEGFNVKNTHYNYMPTITGPGHASIYSGTTPENHGIVSNDWYNRESKKTMYCAEDTTVLMVDSDKKELLNIPIGNRSPQNLKTTTITDELKLFSNGRSKVIGVSLKDRGAIFPAGHLADAAYWYNANNGNFVSSTYYLETLPEWLVAFNNSHKADSLLNLTWNTFLTRDKYIHSGADDASFEKVYKGRETSTFPYHLKKLRKTNGNYSLLAEVPYGNTLVTQLAIEAIKKEGLGQGKEIDFLTISYSATDYIGHHFGIRSKEVEDAYVRMDREIATLLKNLNKEVGKGNYTLFLTADHGASDTPNFLKTMRLPGEFYTPEKIKKRINADLSEKFGVSDYISFIDNAQLYFNETSTSKELVIKRAASFLRTIEGVKSIYTPNLLHSNSYENSIDPLVKTSVHLENSGDILFEFHSGWMEERPYGTTHGSTYTSDTHVPLLFYGHGIPKGVATKKHVITQIAPTLSMILDIPLPNTSNRKPIDGIFTGNK
ncbi:alkaline phosphatase family protein [Cellulophaga sp. HaHa_2_95]|uniref:alkaline phosphatase PafA n=1 Tax=unclassified Cellulophaga TaxID=2634405 RepID=UPI001C4F9764|nr:MULTISPECIES: alkaline phosphatase PafA [unclassified Cellulophaga]QXP51438.1 alkaline phosphatase family protein [Cellulophaga sp. HaHa_2_1]QXP56238.1 alkaline phosphatase family protein [Cellulophaga sp. HaHa_2_95]